MADSSLPEDPWRESLLDQALAEDVGSGDVTTAMAVSTGSRAVGRVVARQEGIIAGLPLLQALYARLDQDVTVELLAVDGQRLVRDQAAALIEGPTAALLTGERAALNFLQHLSGIATLTASYVAAVQAAAGDRCQILDTRKTLPGWRALAKYAVRCGGGKNHRSGLYDRILIKDNHWNAASTGIDELVSRGRRLYPGLEIEVEVDSLEQLDRVLPLRIEWVLLDNFTPEQAAVAVRRRDQAGLDTLLEASGNVTLETAAAFARAGVDACSIGRLTHSAPALDLALDLALVPGRGGGRSAGQRATSPLPETDGGTAS